jgi:predicted TIM-barrel fold metal-dependent hydrolase
MPYEKKVHQMKDHVEAIRSLEISDEVKENIFHKNLERILGIL